MSPFTFRFGRRFGASGAVVLFTCALVACSDVGDNTGLGGSAGGQDSAVDGTVVGEGGGSGDTGASSEDAGGGEDVAQGSDTGAGNDGSQQGSEDSASDAPVVEENGGGNPPEAGPDAPSTEPEASAPEAAAPEAAAPEAAAPETGAPDASPDGEADASADSSVHVDAGSDAAIESGVDGSGGALVPCTSAGQTGCVKCLENSGVCTPTEAALLQIDIDNGKVTAPGPAPADPGDGTICYTCMADNFCLDNSSQTGFECGDSPASFTNGAGASVSGPTVCLNTLECITGTAGMNCPNAANGIGECYCGPSLTPTQCQTATSQNGPCLSEEIAGFAYTPGATAANTILGEFTTQTQPSGIANALLACALGNPPDTCACVKH
jgi:hypothetical protein